MKILAQLKFIKGRDIFYEILDLGLIVDLKLQKKIMTNSLSIRNNIINNG